MDVEGPVTLTTLLIPRTVDDVFGMWKDLERVFGAFMPRGFEFITSHPNLWYKFLAAWLWVLEEDGWVERKFGKLGQTQEDGQGRTIFFRFHLWSDKFGAAPEPEET